MSKSTPGDFAPSTNFDFAPADLSGIYLGLSENNVENLEDESKNEKLLSIFNKTFSEKFKQIDSKLLSANLDLINRSFIMFWKNSKLEDNKICCVFIFYCDYFDIDYNLVYKKLHTKLKNKIENDLITLVGGFANYQKICKNLKSDQNTLFDLI